MTTEAVKPSIIDPNYWRVRAERGRLAASHKMERRAKERLEEVAAAYELLAKDAAEWPGP